MDYYFAGEYVYGKIPNWGRKYYQFVSYEEYVEVFNENRIL